ncbi:MAG: hypothetical protein COW30_01000 [Rhodospirillales bacterium CG15_BIG_FIL_POST_REV_8_21_14_020_66_15]|nr:MAG: hypothetical protein COW30_01000 [Rhodospirillales bacterium CG15_BIG_FIL_POST_REV_8_21_14_020_66_15]
MSKKLGKATIKADGRKFDSYPGASYDPGGTVREARVGHTVHGFSESEREGSIEFEIDYDETVSITQLRNIAGATVTFEPDAGPALVGRAWWVAEPPTWTDGSESRVKIVMKGPALEEVGAANG